ncbi:MAG: hypothetical protein DPW09_05775 [Anaerolineae bacterium]|nr:hypothetical protein [Anaerolineae bacterium]
MIFLKKHFDDGTGRHIDPKAGVQTLGRNQIYPGSQRRKLQRVNPVFWLGANIANRPPASIFNRNSYGQPNLVSHPDTHNAGPTLDRDGAEQPALPGRTRRRGWAGAGGGRCHRTALILISAQHRPAAVVNHHSHIGGIQIGQGQPRRGKRLARLEGGAGVV